MKEISASAFKFGIDMEDTGGSRTSIWGAHGQRGARAYNGGLGRTPSGVQGQSPWSGGQEGEALLKLKAF